MALTAFIFDVDGTLIDSNREHVRAWHTALKAHHYEVSPDRIAVEIGKGGDKLVPSILGDEINRRNGDSLRKAQSEAFTAMAKSSGLRVFPGVDSLLNTIRGRGFSVALATSSGLKDLQITQQCAGVDWSNRFDVITTAEDAAETKPAPHILQAAIRKLKISPAECVMVGDTPYDADTARDSGVICLGLTCGGMNDRKTLRANGMRIVYRDPSDLHAHFDDAIHIASPGPAKLTGIVMDALMRQALAVARQGMDRGEVPIGSVIARGDGVVIASGHNELNASQNKTAHAEMVTFGRAAGKVPHDARDLILVSTLEPCVMCLGASMEAAIDTVICGMNAPTDGGRLRVRPPISPESQMPRIIRGILADESRQLLRQFLQRTTTNLSQITYVRDLLESSQSDV